MYTYIDDLKILIVGNSGSGKTNILKKWTENNFIDTYDPTSVTEFGSKIFENEGKSYHIQLWDISGQDKEHSTTKIFAQNAHGCIIVSDANNVKTREE